MSNFCKLLLSGDLVQIHSPATKAMMTKMGKFPVDFSNYDDLTIFKDVLTERPIDPTVIYYRVYEVLQIISHKQLSSIDFIMSIEDPEAEDNQPYLF